MLGFSQGAAVAAALAAMCPAVVGEGEGQSGESGESGARGPAEGEGGGGGGDGLAAEWPFRFAVLCSGYVSEARQIAEVATLLAAPVS